MLNKSTLQKINTKEVKNHETLPFLLQSQAYKRAATARESQVLREREAFYDLLVRFRPDP